MKFSDDIKNELKNKFKDTGIELGDGDIDEALFKAYAQFSTTTPEGPSKDARIPVEVSLAADVLRPIMKNLFSTPTDDGGEHTTQSAPEDEGPDPI